MAANDLLYDISNPPSRFTLRRVIATELGKPESRISVVYVHELGQVEVTARDISDGVFSSATEVMTAAMLGHVSTSAKRLREWRRLALRAADRLRTNQPQMLNTVPVVNSVLSTSEFQSTYSWYTTQMLPHTVGMMSSYWDTNDWHDSTVQFRLTPVIESKMPKAGDLVRDKSGRVIGVWSADGTVDSVENAVSAQIAALERDGVPVEPQTVRRAIDLSGKMGK